MQCTFRDAVDTDIHAINALFCSEYGDGYPYLVTELAFGHIHLVAVVEREIVGFARAAPYGVYADVWELCSLVVMPEFRQHQIARALTIERINRLRMQGVKTVVSEAVTCYENCASQKNLQNFGFKPYGLLPFVHPWIRPEVLGEQPLSLVLMVASLNGGTGFGSRELFLDPSDRSALELLVPTSDLQPPWESTARDRDVFPRRLHGKQVHGLRGSVFVDIPLNQKEATEVRSLLKRKGYRFAAVLPGFGRDQQHRPFDLLRVYRPPHRSFTFDLVYVTPDLEFLKQYCEQEFKTF